jgi:hypothetical protein
MVKAVRRRPHLALAVLAYLLVILSVLEGFGLGIQNSEPSSRLRVHAIPVALSQLYHDWPHDYTANLGLALRFQGKGKTMDLVRAAATRTPLDRSSVYYWTADDRGLADFVYFSFALFGPHLQSLFAFWFVLLAVAVSAFVVGAKRDTFALAVLCCGVAGVLAALPLYVRAPGGNFAELSVHISESRLFEIPGAVPALFLLLSIADPKLLSNKGWYPAAAVQALILGFLLHCRSSVGWLFVALVGIGFLGALYWTVKRKDRGRAGRALVIPALLLCTWVGVLGYQRAMFNPAYFGEIGPRTVWHNALMGLKYNPQLASAVQVTEVDDHQAVRAVLRYMKETHDPRLTEEWNETTILNSLGGVNRFDWATYEKVARDLVLRTLAAHPLSAIKLVVFDKPKAIVESIGCSAMLLCSSTQYFQASRPDARFEPTNGLMLVIATAIAALLARGSPPRAEAKDDSGAPLLISTALGIVCVLSLAPSLLFYPAITQLGGLFVFGTILFYLGIVRLLAAFFRRHPAFEPARA